MLTLFFMLLFYWVYTVIDNWKWRARMRKTQKLMKAGIDAYWATAYRGGL